MLPQGCISPDHPCMCVHCLAVVIAISPFWQVYLDLACKDRCMCWTKMTFEHFTKCNIVFISTVYLINYISADKINQKVKLLCPHCLLPLNNLSEIQKILVRKWRLPVTHHSLLHYGYWLTEHFPLLPSALVVKGCVAVIFCSSTSSWPLQQD